MNNKLEIYKQKMIYRAAYRGTKEMDILLSSFVNKYIDNFDESFLSELDKFLSFEDEVISNFYYYDIKKNQIEKNKISEIFKKYKP